MLLCSFERSFGISAISIRSKGLSASMCSSKSSVSDLPVNLNTSNARCMRCESFGLIRDADCGSTLDSFSCTFGHPISSASLSSSARIVSSRSGRLLIPSLNDLKYNMVPPTNRGSFP